MPQVRDGRLGVYRCPVCSYRDLVVMEGDGTRAEILCAHCETPLSLTTRGAYSLTLRVRVAERGLPST